MAPLSSRLVSSRLVSSRLAWPGPLAGAATMPMLAYAGAVAYAVIWGCNIPAVKVALSGFSPIWLLTLRFALVAVLVVPFVRLDRREFRGAALLSVVMGVVHFGILMLAIDGLDSATAAILVQLGTPISVLLGILIFRERLAWIGWAGLALAFAGVVVLSGEPHRPSPVPVMLVVLAATAWAAGNLIIKRIASPRPLALTGWLCLMAVPQLALLSWIFEDGQIAQITSAPLAAWGGLAFNVIGSSLIGYTIFYTLLARYPVNHVVPFNLLVPVVGMIVGLMLLGEPLTWQKLAGGALTLSGLAVLIALQVGWIGPRSRRPAAPLRKDSSSQDSSSQDSSSQDSPAQNSPAQNSPPEDSRAP